MDSQELLKLKNRYNIIGSDASLSVAIETAVTIAPSNLAVLITGESGVGKDVFPRMIHDASRRKNNRYLAINCGSIPVGTINAELFGHEKGSFTGAIAERKGYFEEADGGTLFLDEIGELPKETQAMLLRVLQDGEFMKVGSSKVEKTDVRIIAATNVNLEHLVARGKFREDLYYRLNGINIKLPSLRERKDDIYTLFRKFSSDFAAANGLCKPVLDFEAIGKIRSYRWPGNIRQLKNFAEVVTALESRPAGPGIEKVDLGAEAVARHLPDEQNTLLPAVQGSTPSAAAFSDDEKQAIIKAIVDLRQEVETLKRIVASGESRQSAALPQSVLPPSEAPDEQESIVESETVSLKKAGFDLMMKTLEKHGGNVKAAARELGISERTIYRKLSANK